MPDYLLLMHADARRPISAEAWPAYFTRLRTLGIFEGGSGIGDGEVARKDGEPAALSRQIGGYIRVRAADMDEARALLVGNPVFEAGGSVEIRELPRD